MTSPASSKAYGVEQRFNTHVVPGGGGGGHVYSVVRSTDSARQSTTTTSNDGQLFLDLPAGSYVFGAFIDYSSGTGQNFKTQFSWDGTGQTIRYHATGIGSGGGVVSGAQAYTGSDQPTWKGNGVLFANAGSILVAGTLIAVDSSRFHFQWAQATSGAFDTTVWIGSALWATG